MPSPQPLQSQSPGAVRSMTGYAHRSEDTRLGRVTIELRSVNSRFADLQFRLSEELRPIEPLLRERMARAVSRGKVECRMQLRAREADAGSIEVNEALIAALARADARVRDLAPDAAPLTVADYLRWQGSTKAAGSNGSVGTGEASDGDFSSGEVCGGEVAGSDVPAGGAGRGETTAADPAISDVNAAANRLWEPLEAMVTLTMAEFVASREREGKRLAQTIAAQVNQMIAVVDGLKPMIPELLAVAQAKLAARLEEAMPQASNGIAPEETFARIRQEVALLGLRSDVTEEFDRLAIHLAEVLRTLEHGGALGKRLDFLTQELNREANTLASKASGVAVTDGAVALKVLIEQMREQVQNME